MKDMIVKMMDCSLIRMIWQIGFGMLKKVKWMLTKFLLIESKQVNSYYLKIL